MTVQNYVKDILFENMDIFKTDETVVSNLSIKNIDVNKEMLKAVKCKENVNI